MLMILLSLILSMELLSTNAFILATGGCNQLQFHKVGRVALPPRAKTVTVVLSLYPTPPSSADEVELLRSIRSLRVKDIKSQLESINISTKDAFEKEELVQRLFRARLASTDVGVAEKPRKKKKKRRQYYDDDGVSIDQSAFHTSQDIPIGQPPKVSPTSSDRSTSKRTDATIVAPFQYFTLDTKKQLQDATAQDIYIRPSPGKYAAVTVKLQSKSTSAAAEYTLLVDTACSGIVLSPEAESRSNGLIQTIKGAASMASAGGDRAGYDVATWGDRSTTKLIIGDVDVNEIDGMGDRMMNMAAINDIGALPDGIDGILGLSLLNKFGCVDFDFSRAELRMYKTIPDSSFDMSTLAEGPLQMNKLGIYNADVLLDGRGPVKLLVDTGAASTFMNWNGVSALGYASSSQQIEPISEAIGAMGADNAALRLTHRYVLKRRWNIQTKNRSEGIYFPGIGIRGTNYEAGINIDIGNIPVLEALRSDNVGGILGADLLMMCDVVRFTGLNGSSPRITMLKH